MTDKKGGRERPTGDALKERAQELGPGWEVVKDHHLEKTFPFPDFRTALEFTNKVGEIAEGMQHHPGIHLSWGKARVVTWSHDSDGITGRDFDLAGKIETLG